MQVVTQLVGPSSGSVSSVVRLGAAPTAGAEQRVSGTTASTALLSVAADGAPQYAGTEPATMQIERRAGLELITVTPR
jgi:hypothetical protein